MAAIKERLWSDATRAAERHLERADEDAEGVQHRQAHLRRHVGLQQALVAHLRLRVGVH